MYSEPNVAIEPAAILAAIVGIALLLGWLATFIVLLVNPRTRVAGFVVLATPLALIMIAGVFWLLVSVRPDPVSLPPEMARQRLDRIVRAEADADRKRAGNKDISAKPAPPAKGDDDVATESHASVRSEPARPAAPSGARFASLLLLAGLVAFAVFCKSRAVRVSLLVVVGLGMMMLVLVVFRLKEANSPQRSMIATEISDDSWNIPTRHVAKRDVKAASPPASARGIPVEAEEQSKVNASKDDAKPPAWANKPPRVVGDSYEMEIVLGPYTTRQECDADVPGELQKALNHYAEMCLGEPAASKIALPTDYLRRHLVKDQWEEIRPSLIVGRNMTQLHLRLQFDPEMKDRILEEHRRGIVAARLWMLGVGSAALLGLLAVIFGYLKADLSTAGAYRGRLRLTAALAILGLAAAALAVV